jgi:hypothetical protein
MEEGVKTIPDIIKAAAERPLGIFALMIICLSLLAFAFFRGANQYVQLAIFLCLFGGVVAFGFSLRSEPNKGPARGESSTSAPTSTPPISKLFDPNRRYKISSVLAKRVLDVKGGMVLDVQGGPAAAKNAARIQLYEWQKDRNQIWFIQEQTGGTYVIRYDSSSLVLEVDRDKDDAKENHDPIQLWQQSTGKQNQNQLWRIESVNSPTSTSGPFYKITSVGSERVLDARDKGTGNGTELQQYDWYSEENQEWYIEEVP